jgi:methylmalonic aciduria homocystinuria type C protein
VDVLATIAQLADAGFDVAQPFDAAAAAREPGLELLGTGVGIVVGNSRALWPKLLAARAADPALADDPVDTYTEQTIARVAPGARAYFAHRRYAGAFVPFQRLAVAAGLGTLSPTHMVVHPVLGPWFGLRAALIFDGERAPAPAPPPSTCTCGAPCLDAFARACETPRDWRGWLAVRDACPLGRAHRYGDDQLAYHYTKDPRFLR